MPQLPAERQHPWPGSVQRSVRGPVPGRHSAGVRQVSGVRARTDHRAGRAADGIRDASRSCAGDCPEARSSCRKRFPLPSSGIPSGHAATALLSGWAQLHRAVDACGDRDDRVRTSHTAARRLRSSPRSFGAATTRRLRSWLQRRRLLGQDAQGSLGLEHDGGGISQVGGALPAAGRTQVLSCNDEGRPPAHCLLAILATGFVGIQGWRQPSAWFKCGLPRLAAGAGKGSETVAP
jgi:hypothetical protein